MNGHRLSYDIHRTRLIRYLTLNPFLNLHVSYIFNRHLSFTFMQKRNFLISFKSKTLISIQKLLKIEEIFILTFDLP